MTMAKRTTAATTDEGDRDADIGALVNEVVALRKAAAAARASAEQAAAKAREAASQVKAANARLLEALRGPRRASAAARNGARWPLAPHAKTRSAILKELDDIGPMTREELRKALPQISRDALGVALAALRREGMIECLRDGSYGLTEAQQAAMRR